MTLIGRDRPKRYERGVDNAAISASLRLQTGEWAVHLGNVGSKNCIWDATNFQAGERTALLSASLKKASTKGGARKAFREWSG